MVSERAAVQCVYTVICQVSDMDRSVTFYRDVIGLAPGHVTPHWSDFKVGDIRIGLHPPFDGAEPPFSVPNKGWILGLEVDDLRALRSQLERAGAEFSREFHDIPGGTLLDFRDPDGHPIQAIQRGVSAKDLS